jgi:hypothetical protein
MGLKLSTIAEMNTHLEKDEEVFTEEVMELDREVLDISNSKRALMLLGLNPSNPDIECLKAVVYDAYFNHEALFGIPHANYARV